MTSQDSPVRAIPRAAPRTRTLVPRGLPALAGGLGSSLALLLSAIADKLGQLASTTLPRYVSFGASSVARVITVLTAAGVALGLITSQAIPKESAA